LPEGAIWGQKWVWFWHEPRVWAPWRAVFKPSVRLLSCLQAFHSTWAWELPVTVPMLNLPLCEPYFSQPNVHTKSHIALNYMLTGILVFL